MVNVILDIIIQRPIEEVMKYAVDPDNAKLWYDNIKVSKMLTEKPLTVGSKILFQAKFLGRTMDYTYEVVDFVPNKVMSMRTSDGPFLMETSYFWTKIDPSTTKMEIQNQGIPTGFSSLLAPMMTMMMKRAMKKDLKKIKRILESS